MSGFIYVMTNQAFPDLIKIGKSQKDPTTDRVNELNQTGVPESFKVEYYAFIGDENKFELFLHKKFSGKRPNPQREFFSGSVSDAVSAIQNNAKQFGGLKYQEVYFSDEDSSKISSKKLWGDGSRHYAKTKKFRKQEIAQTGVLETLKKGQGLMANHRKSLFSGFISNDETREQYKAQKKGNLK